MPTDTPTTIFARIATRVAGNPDWARRVGAILRIIVTGDGGGDWFANVAADAAPPLVRTYDSNDVSRVQTTLEWTAEEFLSYYASPGTATREYLAGQRQTKVTGSKPAAARVSLLIAMAK